MRKRTEPIKKYQKPLARAPALRQLEKMRVSSLLSGKRTSRTGLAREAAHIIFFTDTPLSEIFFVYGIFGIGAPLIIGSAVFDYLQEDNQLTDQRKQIPQVEDTGFDHIVQPSNGHRNAGHQEHQRDKG